MEAEQEQLREWTYFEGRWAEGPVPVATSGSHALWMGSSVFDGARWFDGVAPDLDLHCARLNASALALGLTPLLRAEEIAAIVREGLRRFAGEVPIYIRPSYFAARGSDHWVPPDPESTTFCLMLIEAPFSPRPGSSLTVSPFRRPTLETMPTNAKAGCLYPNSARAINEALARGFDNALMLDAAGNVAETATSNIFLVRHGKVFTPVLNGTFLAGITRARIIRLLRAAGLGVGEVSLTVRDFLEADEIFTTGNYSKVAPVTRFEQRTLPVGEVTSLAKQLYLEWARSETAPEPEGAF